MPIRLSLSGLVIGCVTLVGVAFGAPDSPSPAPSPKPSARPTAKPTARPSATQTAKPNTSPSANGFPMVVLRDRTGKKVPLSKYLAKKPIVLYLYSNPVDQTAINLQNLQAQMDNLGVQAIAIHGDRAYRDRARIQFQTVAIAYPVLLDDGTVARTYATSADPTLVLVAPDGREVKRWINFEAVDKLSVQLKEALREVVASPPENPK